MLPAIASWNLSNEAFSRCLIRSSARPCCVCRRPHLNKRIKSGERRIHPYKVPYHKASSLEEFRGRKKLSRVRYLHEIRGKLTKSGSSRSGVIHVRRTYMVLRIRCSASVRRRFPGLNALCRDLRVRCSAIGARWKHAFWRGKILRSLPACGLSFLEHRHRRKSRRQSRTRRRPRTSGSVPAYRPVSEM